MNTKRLLKLAEFLETKVPRKEFDMTCFSRGPKPGCGTAACALGWATQIPSFKRLGLKLVGKRSPFYQPDYNGNRNFKAGEVFFDITHHMSLLLFNYESYPLYRATPKQVAKRIRQLVAGNNIPTQRPYIVF